jgi:hypothetical protein
VLLLLPLLLQLTLQQQATTQTVWCPFFSAPVPGGMAPLSLSLLLCLSRCGCKRVVEWSVDVWQDDQSILNQSR